jgi:N-acylneuraminate cytidylyltransferase/CMP-N,N'-diacetyllegionaminic acid synthase
MSQIIGLITARGGSKSIPRKNIKMLAGKPLIAWTIEAAVRSRRLNRVVVSTDAEEIAQISRQWGAEVPFMRPMELAQDDTSGIAPVLHAVDWLAQHEGYEPDFVLMLQPTSPLRTAEDIEAAIKLVIEHEADSVVSVCEVKHHPYWAMKIEAEGTLSNFLGLDLRVMQEQYPRRQDLPSAYVENGAIYLAKPSVLLEREAFYGDRLFGYVMPRERSIDIDTGLDLQIAEFLLEKRIEHE